MLKKETLVQWRGIKIPDLGKRYPYRAELRATYKGVGWTLGRYRQKGGKRVRKHPEKGPLYSLCKVRYQFLIHYSADEELLWQRKKVHYQEEQELQ